MTKKPINNCFGHEDLFFSELFSKVMKAKELCSTCPMMESGECLENALANPEWSMGTWAGLTYEERAV